MTFGAGESPVMRPNLDPWDVVDIAAAPELADWLGEGRYGASLAEVLVESGGFVHVFLVLASLAGHAPMNVEGVCAALLALHAWNVAEANEVEASGADGDALDLLDASEYRRVTALLERLTADMEARASELHRAPTPYEVTPAQRAVFQRQSVAAASRAVNALKRAIDVQKDTEDAEAEGESSR